MASVNKVILVGFVGKDPEVRNTQNGQKVVSLSLATSESWNDKRSGEKVERTEWHRIVIMNDVLGDLVEKYARKGSRIYVEGTLQTRKWTDQAGVERYTTEVFLGRFGGSVVLLDRQQGGSEDRRQPTATTRAPTSGANNKTPGAQWEDDDIPF